MKFTRPSAQCRRQLERKKRAVKLHGGKVTATHSSAELPMRHATLPPEPELADYSRIRPGKRYESLEQQRMRRIRAGETP